MTKVLVPFFGAEEVELGEELEPSDLDESYEILSEISSVDTDPVVIEHTAEGEILEPTAAAHAKQIPTRFDRSLDCCRRRKDRLDCAADP